MGSSYWRVTVPLESTIEEAFNRARHQVFQAGDYVGADSGPASIPDALEAAGADGTHSILDLERILVGTAPPSDSSSEQQLLIAMGLATGELHSQKAYEAPATALLEACGAERPTRAEFDAAEDQLTRNLKKRGFGYYVLLRDDAGREAEVVFFGWTGD